MLRFIVVNRFKCQVSGCESTRYETIDVDVPELEDRLRRGGSGENGYDVTDLVGVEVLDKTRSPDEQTA